MEAPAAGPVPGSGAVLVLAGIAALIQRVWLLGLGPEELTAANLTPFGGMLVVDEYGVFAHLLLIVLALCGLGAGWRFFESLGRRGAEGLALLLLSTAGFALMASTPHLVMMFLGLEIGSISLYVLAGFTRSETASEEAAIKYFLLGSFASAIFIYGVALLFAGTGSLNLFEQRAFLAANIILRPAVLLAGLALDDRRAGFQGHGGTFSFLGSGRLSGGPGRGGRFHGGRRQGGRLRRAGPAPLDRIRRLFVDVGGRRRGDCGCLDAGRLLPRSRPGRPAASSCLLGRRPRRIHPHRGGRRPQRDRRESGSTWRSTPSNWSAPMR